MYLTMRRGDGSCPMCYLVAADVFDDVTEDVSCPMRQHIAGDVFDDVPGRCQLSDESAGRWRCI